MLYLEAMFAFMVFLAVRCRRRPVSSSATMTTGGDGRCALPGSMASSVLGVCSGEGSGHAGPRMFFCIRANFALVYARLAGIRTFLAV